MELDSTAISSVVRIGGNAIRKFCLLQVQTPEEGGDVALEPWHSPKLDQSVQARCISFHDAHFVAKDDQKMLPQGNSVDFHVFEFLVKQKNLRSFHGLKPNQYVMSVRSCS